MVKHIYVRMFKEIKTHVELDKTNRLTVNPCCIITFMFN